MYNFFVTSRSGAWELPAFEYEKSRFLEFSNDKEKALFKTLTLENIELLKSFPCLFAYEGWSSDLQVGYLRAIKERSGAYLVEYELDREFPRIPYEKIAVISNLLDIRMSEWSRTHWAVKDEDLFLRLQAAKLIDSKLVQSAAKVGRLEEMQFKVAFSFPGEDREYVSKVAARVKADLPAGSVFYDDDFTAQLARPNLDNLLQTVYLKNSDLIVAFLSSDYERKMWCGVEWRAIRNIINNKSDAAVMFVRFDDAEVAGVFPHDGYVDARRFSADKVGEFVLERVRLNDKGY